MYYLIKVSINISNNNFGLEIIGKVTYNYRNSENILLKNKRLKENLKHPLKAQLISYKTAPIDIHVIDNQIIIVDDSSLLLYDGHFNLLKKINKLNDQIFRALSITSTTSKNSHVYMSTIDNKILMTDLDFNLLKSIGTFGADVYQFNIPSSIVYADGFLYVCDNQNLRIKKYDSNLIFKAAFKLDFKPFQIRVNDKTACVRHDYEMEIFFFDTETFTLKQKYIGHNGSICTLFNHFYEYCSSKEKIFCYNESGKLFDEIDCNELCSNVKFTGFECFIYFNNQLYISNDVSKNFIVI
jgi:hypothetical protein